MPLAQQRIDLDLDDGVKVTGLKLKAVQARIPGLAAKERRPAGRFAGAFMRRTRAGAAENTAPWTLLS